MIKTPAWLFAQSDREENEKPGVEDNVFLFHPGSEYVSQHTALKLTPCSPLSLLSSTPVGTQRGELTHIYI